MIEVDDEEPSMQRLEEEEAECLPKARTSGLSLKATTFLDGALCEYRPPGIRRYPAG